MTIKIEIEVPQDLVVKEAGAWYLNNALGALGWQRALRDAVVTGYGVTETDAEGNVAHVTSEQFRGASGEDEGSDLPKAEAPATAGIDTRAVGEPGGDKKRRNSDEKAADDTLEALAAKAGVAIEKLNAVIADNGRAAAEAELRRLADNPPAEEKPAISSGENRVGPEDDPETEAQDKADEQAEAAAKSDGSITHDDLRRAVGAYQKAHGMAAAVRAVAPDGFIGCTIDKVPAEKLAEMIAKVEAATGEAPAKQADPEPAKTEEPAAKPATKDDLVGAMKAYARKYDGQDTDMNAMPHTMADCPAIFKKLFGEKVDKLSLVPTDQYGPAVAAINEAIEKNPFGRGAK